MANQITGDGVSINWSVTSNQPHLPPKIPLNPSFPNVVSSLPDNGNKILSNFSNFPYPRGSQRQHHRTPSATLPSPTPFSWIDDLLTDSSEALPKRNSHRRSSSDSAAFLDAPVNYERGDYMAEEDNFDCGSVASIPSRESQDFDKLDEEQLMSMFADIEPFQKQNNQASDASPQATVSEKRTPAGESPSTPSDQNSANDSYEEKGTENLGNFKGEPEVQSDDNNEFSKPQAIKGESMSMTSIDPALDPKRAKRIIANRLSAQRSRVRKLQYISELERSVNALQAEVSSLSPQVAYLDHQRVILNVDNSALKQRMAALAQDKLFKDAHYEALKKEVQRLRHMYQQQHHHHLPFEMEKIGLVGNAMQHNNSNSEPCESSAAEIMKCNQGPDEERCCLSKSEPNPSLIPNAIENIEGLEGRMLSGSAPVHSDFFS